ncbi:MAG: NERD domain-containing protein [Sulfurovum sp.]|nr:NERD domain-containing protein [Sulfurovum sp.]
MILKQRDEKPASNKYEKAGERAEEQMVYYLQRAFRDDKDIVVLNDIRIEDAEGEVAQMDHLIVHEFGFIIVESKSVTTEITINEEGEWIRHFNGKKGMRSPIKQAQMQAEILKKVLESNKDKLFKKNFVNKMLKISFENYPFDVLIAISDTGIINRPKKFDTSMVLKADLICDRIRDIIRDYRKKSKSLLPIDIPASFYHTTILVIGEFLKSKHMPVRVSVGASEDKIEEPHKTYGKKFQNKEKKAQTDIFTCRSCHSKNLQIVWGKYGYYFKCQECDGNTPIKLVCKNKDCQVKLKKDKNEFYQVCETCNTRKLFYVNQ